MSPEDDPILCTKLYFPPLRFKPVARPRLVQQIEQGLQRRLTLISASAGYGKTTLLSEWRLNKPDEPVAWLSLDASDNDPARFLAYVVAALKTVLPDLTFTGTISPQPHNIKLALTNLINAVSTAISRQNLASLILVLEDYHVVESEVINSAVSFLLNNMPPEMHLVITTRIEPALPLHRLMAHDQIWKLGTADLRFNQAEATAFMNQTMGSEFRPEELAQLAERTEGWAVGLQLAALSLKDRRDVKSFLKAFSGNNRFVLGYLGEEVLGLLPEDTRTFLLETAVLERFNASLVEAVCLIENADQLITYLEAANLFLIPLDETGDWYRYHRLFAEFLLHRLQQEQPAKHLELHRRAGQWFEQQGYLSEATDHYLASRDYDSAARLIEKVAAVMITRGELTTLDGWFKQLPPAVFETRPALCLYYAWKLYLRRQFEQHEQYLQIAENAWTNENNLARLGEVFLLRAHFSHTQGDYPAAVGFAERALELLPETELANRGNAKNALGWAALMSGEAERSHQAFAEGRMLCRQSRNLLGEQSCLHGLADAVEMQGRLREGRPLFEEALRLLPDKPEFVAMIEIRLGQLYLEWNQLDLSDAYLAHLESLVEQGVDLTSQPGGYMFMAEMSWVRGDYETAFERIAQSYELARRANFSFVIDQITAYEGWLWLNLGDTARLDQWLQEHFPDLNTTLPTLPITYQLESKNLTLGAILLSRHRIAETLQLLGWMEELALRQGRVINLMQILTLTTLTHYVGGNLPAALALLEKVLVVAEREGYRRQFLNHGPPMKSLLQTAVPKLPKFAPYLRSLLNETFVGDDAPARPEPTPEPAVPVYSHPSSSGEVLSERELEVLRLINKGASNQKIAETLVLAVSTVKKHLTRIFDKLEVTNRTEALARARELGLL